MNLKHKLNLFNVDVINYLSIEVLENKGITKPTERQIQSVEKRLTRALKKGALNLKAHTQVIKGESIMRSKQQNEKLALKNGREMSLTDAVSITLTDVSEEEVILNVEWEANTSDSHGFKGISTQDDGERIMMRLADIINQKTA